MPLFFQVLASGSRGNAILVCSSRTRILVDAGLSGKQLNQRLDKSPAKGSDLHALLITHEHTDHVQGAGVLSRRWGLPVYLSQGTLENLPKQVGQLAAGHIFSCGSSFRIGDLTIRTFSIPHDARDPVGFVVEHEGTRLGICTDLGVATQLVRARLQGCHALVLESNHDPHLLLTGPYPPHLKQRVCGRHGHLSNPNSCALLKELYHEGLRSVVLAHLSEVNNSPAHVMESIGELRKDSVWENVRFHIGMQREATPAVEIA